MAAIVRHLRLAPCVVALVLSAVTADVSAVQAAASHPVRYLVITPDASGRAQVQRVDQQRFEQVLAQGEAIAAQRTPSSGGTTIVPLINRVSDTACRDRTDFWKLWNNTTIAHGVCFANNGTININVFNVFRITTGNNAGNFVADGQHFPGNGLQFCSFDNIGISPPFHDVTLVSITGRSASPCV